MNVEAVDRMLVSLGDRLTDDQAAFVAAVRGLAAVVDNNTADLSAWREYRLMLQALQEVLGSGDVDHIENLLAQFDTQVGNSKDAG